MSLTASLWQAILACCEFGASAARFRLPLENLPYGVFSRRQ